MAAARCIDWYYPAPTNFSRSAGVTESLWISGTDSLSQYDGHPELLQLADTVVTSANPWVVQSATWDGTWLRIDATHAQVTDGGPVPAPQSRARPMPRAPSKVLPAPGAGGDVGGALTITLDPNGASDCRQQWVPSSYQ
jgi:hypothetical protein